MPSNYSSHSRSDYEDDYRRGRGGRSDDGRQYGHGGWFGDPEGHSEASRRGWENSDHAPSGWFGDPEGHSEASRRGWQHGHEGNYGPRGGRYSRGYENEGSYSRRSYR